MNLTSKKYRTGSKRILAAIVDGLVFIPLSIVDRYLLGETSNTSLLIFWQLFEIFIPIFYSVFAHYKYGMTIGKWVVGVKVLDISETQNMTILQSFLRDSVYLLVQIAALLYYATLVFKTGEVEDLYSDFESFTSAPLFVWTLLELVTMLANSKRRAVHDFLARSVVVRLPKNGV